MFHRTIGALILALVLAGLVAAPAASQGDSASRSWNRPVAPFRIIDSIYYVGAANVSSFLIVSSGGHILLDGGFVETAPQILANIRRLGYEPGDVRYLIVSHAHFDHVGGLAELQQATGAELLASPEDAALLRRGGLADFAFGDTAAYPEVRADRMLRDRETVSAGGLRLTARFTPGHTKGCTTWTTQARDGERLRHVLFTCSTSVPGYRLVGNAGYPTIAEDYRRSFTTLMGLPCDVLLAPHGSFFDLEGKRARLAAAEGSNPFVHPEGCRAHLRSSQADFEQRLQRQQSELSPPAP